MVYSWTQELGCPSNRWILSGDTCYYVDSDSVLSWDSANQMCQTLGGETARLALSLQVDLQVGHG